MTVTFSHFRPRVIICLGTIFFARVHPDSCIFSSFTSRKRNVILKGMERDLKWEIDTIRQTKSVRVLSEDLEFRWFLLFYFTVCYILNIKLASPTKSDHSNALCLFVVLFILECSRILFRGFLIVCSSLFGSLVSCLSCLGPRLVALGV